MSARRTRSKRPADDEEVGGRIHSHAQCKCSFVAELEMGTYSIALKQLKNRLVDCIKRQMLSSKFLTVVPGECTGWQQDSERGLVRCQRHNQPTSTPNE